MRRRILIVEPSGLLWGSERALLDLLAHLDATQLDVVVALPPHAPLAEHLDAIGVRHLAVPMELLHQRGRLARARATAALHRLVGRIKPDVIHLNQAGLLRVVQFSTARRAPILAHVRLFEDARMIRERERAKPSKVHYVAISHAIYDAMEPSAWGGVERVHVVYDPFDADRFLATRTVDSQRTSPREAPVVAMIGRLCASKGQATLIDAITRLHEPAVHALFVGGDAPGTSEREKLERHAIERDVAHRVTFTGERADVADVMAEADAVVMTSNEEPFGRVLLEALISGTPVIAARSGGAAEIIGDDERGLGFAPGDAAGLADCIRRTLKNREAARERTERGRAFVTEVCSPARHAAAINSLYDRVTGRDRRERSNAENAQREWPLSV